MRWKVGANHTGALTTMLGKSGKWKKDIKENPKMCLLHAEIIGLSDTFGFAVGIIEVKTGDDQELRYQSFCVRRQDPEWSTEGIHRTVRERADFNSAWADLGWASSHARAEYRADVGPVSFPAYEKTKKGGGNDGN